MRPAVGSRFSLLIELNREPTASLIRVGVEEILNSCGTWTLSFCTMWWTVMWISTYSDVGRYSRVTDNWLQDVSWMKHIVKPGPTLLPWEIICLRYLCNKKVSFSFKCHPTPFLHCRSPSNTNPLLLYCCSPGPPFGFYEDSVLFKKQRRCIILVRSYIFALQTGVFDHLIYYLLQHFHVVKQAY